MGTNQPNETETEHPALRRLQRAFVLVFGVIFVGGTLLVGVTPGGWDAIGGVVMASIMAFIVMRDEVAKHLTEAQAWAMYALVGTVCVTLVVVSGSGLSGELLFGYLVCLAAGLFGYRTKAAS